jgi:hypothetical protein
MDEKPEAKQATPHSQLISELMDSRVPKTEREHAAAREIERLREALEQPEQSITPRELAAALGWPGGISDPVLDKVEVLRMVARRHCESGGEMTQGDIIRMAREVGASAFDQAVVFSYAEAARFAALVAAAEREACEKVCNDIVGAEAEDCAAAIRARGQG